MASRASPTSPPSTVRRPAHTRQLSHANAIVQITVKAMLSGFVIDGSHTWFTTMPPKNHPSASAVRPVTPRAKLRPSRRHRRAAQTIATIAPIGA
jgi:hypothetical protein